MKRSERGSNLVEMALIAPVLLIILFGIADVGRAFSGYITMTNAVREGARYAARRPFPRETENIQKRRLSRSEMLIPLWIAGRGPTWMSTLKRTGLEQQSASP